LGPVYRRKSTGSESAAEQRANGYDNADWHHESRRAAVAVLFGRERICVQARKPERGCPGRSNVRANRMISRNQTFRDCRSLPCWDYRAPFLLQLGKEAVSAGAPIILAIQGKDDGGRAAHNALTFD